MHSRMHLQHHIRQTSLLAFQDELPHLGKRQYEVLKAIRDLNLHGIHPTDREIAKLLGYADPNKVRPRRHELMEYGLIIEAGERIIKNTLRWANNLKIIGEVEDISKIDFIEHIKYTKINHFNLPIIHTEFGDVYLWRQWGYPAWAIDPLIDFAKNIGAKYSILLPEGEFPMFIVIHGYAWSKLIFTVAPWHNLIKDTKLIYDIEIFEAKYKKLKEWMPSEFKNKKEASP